MAATLAASKLTEGHRLAQARIGAKTTLAMFAVWPLLDTSDLDGTFDRWLQAINPIVQSQRTVSARLAGNYMTTFRALELGITGGRFAPVLDETVPVEQLLTSMLVTGPASIRSNLARGMKYKQAVDIAKGNTARAAMRHAMDGGRGTITRTVEADRVALGWARATSGKTCAFCALVASRGPVYKSKTSAEKTKDGKRYHDGCNCTSEPVYRSDAEWPAGSQRYREIYEQSTQGAESPAAARNAFRQALAAG